MKRKELIGVSALWTGILFTAFIYIFGRLIPYFEMITSIWGIFILVYLISYFIYGHIL